MTREDVKKIFPDATDEQITSFLNQSNSDVAKEKAKSQKFKEQADKADQYEKELEELKQQNMTDAEKLEAERQKEKAEAEKRFSDMENSLAEANKKLLFSEISTTFANAGLSIEIYSGAIKAFSIMPAEEAKKEAEAFVKGVSEENKSALDTAKANWEKEVLNNTPNPGGGKNNDKKEEKSAAADFAKQYSARMNPEIKPANDNAPANF